MSAGRASGSITSPAMPDAGSLQHYLDADSVTGLTSNPLVFDTAIASGILRLLFTKIPGTAEGLPGITECVAAGVPVSVLRWRAAG